MNIRKVTPKDYNSIYTFVKTAFATAEENPYITILGTARTKEDLQKLYRSYMKKLHPDVCKEYSLEESTHRTILLNDAYDYWKRQYQYC